MAASRMTTIDAARGSAMVLVCLSHFAWVHFAQGGDARMAGWLNTVGLVASPTFVLLSGMLLGYLETTWAGEIGELRRKLVDRALVLLTIARLLMVLAHVPRSDDPVDALRYIFLTDIVAVSLLVGALVARRVGASSRVAIGAGLFVIGSTLAPLSEPGSPILRLFKDALVGPAAENSWHYASPLVQWLGFYLACSALGMRLARARDAAGRLAFERVLLRSGLAAVSLAVLLRVSYLALSAWGLLPDGGFAPMLGAMLSPWQKTPPSLVYFLLFGGTALLLCGLIFLLERRQVLGRIRAQAAVLGRVSLFVFVLQYQIYFALMFGRTWLRELWWPVAFGGSLLVIFLLSRAWDAGNLNRLLTLRLKVPHSRFRYRLAAAALVLALAAVVDVLAYRSARVERLAESEAVIQPLGDN